MSEPAGRAVTPAGLPGPAGAGGADSPARREIGQPRAWLAAAASYAAIGTVFQVLPPYTAAAGRALEVSATAAGLGMTVFLLPVPLLAVPAGAFCDRHGSRLLTRAGFAVLLTAAVLLAAVPGFGWLLAARAVGGLGAGLVMVDAQPRGWRAWRRSGGGQWCAQRRRPAPAACRAGPASPGDGQKAPGARTVVL